MRSLTGSQRKYLRGLAHALDPIVWIGASGLTENAICAIDAALRDHELIKVKFLEHKDEKERIGQEIEERTGSEMVGMIGHILIFYREQTDEQKRRIQFPIRSGNGEE